MSVRVYLSCSVGTSVRGHIGVNVPSYVKKFDLDGQLQVLDLALGIFFLTWFTILLFKLF